MSYEVFQNQVRKLISKVDDQMPVHFRESDDGRYFADADGITIIGRAGSLKVTVRYGSGHQMMTIL